jgi:hypothetical protein
MTWKELSEAILGLTTLELSLPAMVFPPEGCPHDAGVPITGLVSLSSPVFGPKPIVPMISTGKPPH